MLAPVSQVTSGSVEALRKVHKPMERNQTDAVAPKTTTEEEPSKPVPTPPKKDVEDRDDNLSQLLKNKRKRSGQDGDA
jgi:hypothetical protein